MLQVGPPSVQHLLQPLNYAQPLNQGERQKIIVLVLWLLWEVL
jgi:hypothetical protein